MIPYLSDSDFTLFKGDAREALRELPAESVHMCVTSPPFFGLRDYGAAGQIGLESTPEEWVAQLVEVFEEVKRVLRKDGTLWVECGDSYAGSWGAQSRRPNDEARSNAMRGISRNQIKAAPLSERTGSIPPGTDLKPKDLIGQPFLLAFALREAGWYWRNVLIWHKPNPMPESVRDRFTVSHSYVLLFSKFPRYFFDAEAVREAHLEPWRSGTKEDRMMKKGSDGISHPGFGNGKYDQRIYNPAGRNARSVWTIATEPLPFEHYAAFPQALAERCIKAGTSERGCCPECGAPWVREVEHGEVLSTGGSKTGGRASNMATVSPLGQDPERSAYNTGDFVARAKITTGWRPSCSHGFGSVVGDPFNKAIPCTVLDPFLGSGTTALVARRLGRKCIGIELNERYCELAAERTQQLSLEAEARLA